MKKDYIDRVHFYPNDWFTGYQLKKSETILQTEIDEKSIDINDILELYHVKKYIDNHIYLKSWSKEFIKDIKNKVIEYGKIIGKFISSINNENIFDYINEIDREYMDSFWEIFNNYKLFKNLSKDKFNEVLQSKPCLIEIILKYNTLVDYYKKEIRQLLLNYPRAAEILLSVYEKEDTQIHIPISLTYKDKEEILLEYLNSENPNLNYVELIQYFKNSSNFHISNKIRLKAKKLYEKRIKDYFIHNKGIRNGICIRFLEKYCKLKYCFREGNSTHFLYNLDFIKNYNDSYSLFKNFKNLFKYVDQQNRIMLVSKFSEQDFFENIVNMPLNYYQINKIFFVKERISYGQICNYSDLLIKELNISIEKIIYNVFTTILNKKYNFAMNAKFNISTSNSYFEKVRMLAPEFESILKQFKLFVEEGEVDFELLQMSSKPLHIKNVPSLNNNKYVYLNEKNTLIRNILNLFFSDQTLLAYVKPYEDSGYNTFFKLLVNKQVCFKNYNDAQKRKLNYLILNKFIFIDENDIVQIPNPIRLMILKDLYDNEVMSYYNCSVEEQTEIIKMKSEGIVYFESSLFSKPEQEYFNYYLNKSEFTNGLDLRNSYVHGTNPPSDDEYHEYAYFTYLKLLFLVMLKIDDDLRIYHNYIQNLTNNISILYK